MVDEAQNKQAMKEAIDTLNLIVSTNSTPKTIKKAVTDLVVDLVKEGDSLSVRAANTLSDSTMTLYDVKSLNFIGNFKNLPVLQSNSAACHPQVITHPSNLPSDKLEPE